MRLALKTASYGSIHVLVAITVVYAVTGSGAAAVGIGVVEPIVQTGVFALHERVWEGSRLRSIRRDLSRGMGWLGVTRCCTGVADAKSTG